MPSLDTHGQVVAADKAIPNERRREGDRRSARPWTAMRYWLLGGKRQQGRRTYAGTASYVDTYHWSLLLIALGIIALNGLDAFFTLTLISRGAIEVNPVMDYLINRDIQMFVNVKLGLTGLCIVLLVMHSPFRFFGRLSVPRILALILLMYGILIGYELVLLSASA